MVITATGETLYSLLDMAGGDNIAADITGWVQLGKADGRGPYLSFALKRQNSISTDKWL